MNFRLQISSECGQGKGEGVEKSTIINGSSLRKESFGLVVRAESLTRPGPKIPPERVKLETLGGVRARAERGAIIRLTAKMKRKKMVFPKGE